MAGLSAVTHPQPASCAVTTAMWRPQHDLRPCARRAHVGVAGGRSAAWQRRQLRQWRRQSAAILTASAPAAAPEKLTQWVADSNTQRLTALEEDSKASCRVASRLPKAPCRGRSVILDTIEHDANKLSVSQDQALSVLQTAADQFEHAAFPCALIAGDVVILHLLHRLGLLQPKNGGKPPVEVIFIDTYHLFPETHQCLHQLENEYGFKAHEFHAAGFASRDEYVQRYGSDLYMTDIEEYDRICKVEPFSRALESLQVDCMINGRRRDHGFDRAFLEVFEAGQPVKCQPLAHWTFADCFAYLEAHNVPAHPLHAQGYPSVGDVHSTITVPRDKWFEYGGERSGRFQGLTNPDGSVKTECGIHNRPA